MRLHLAPAVMAGSITLSAFLFGCNTTVTTSIAPPAGCSQDNNLGCRQGSEGFTCTAGTNPEDIDSNLSCSIPVADGANDDFCCFDFHGSASTCTPDDTITQFCQPGSFGYVCAPGDEPTTLDPSLNCSAAQPNGNEDDFCCE
jgi:hypothetical protein